MKQTVPILLAALVTGCAQTPLPPPTPPALAAQWRSGPTQDGTGASWWKAFADPRLDALEAQALAGNLDIQQALARLDQVRSVRGAAGAALAPAVNLDASAGRVQQSLNAGLGPLAAIVPGYARTADPGQLGLSSSWELDFAGGLRQQREAAAAMADASAAEWSAWRLAITAEVADAYLTALGMGLQHAALARQLALLARQQHTMEVRLRVGAAAQTELDLVQARIAETTAPLAALASAVAQQKYRLAVLLGRDPSGWEPDLPTAAALPVAADPLGGQPVDLLRRRPDVLAAQRRVASANARVAASLAEYYPRISLSAAAGQEASTMANLDASRSSFVQTFLGLRWRLFDFGRIDAEVARAKGQQQEALLAYRAAVLRAASEVESSFAQLAAARESRQQLQAQSSRVQQVWQTLQRSHALGAASLDEVHTAERQVAKVDYDLATADLAIARAVVAAARALGGPVAD